jgi:hypothetical protein
MLTIACTCAGAPAAEVPAAATPVPVAPLVAISEDSSEEGLAELLINDASIEGSVYCAEPELVPIASAVPESMAEDRAELKLAGLALEPPVAIFEL